MKRQDIVSGIVLAGLGIFVTLHARTLTYRDEFGPGPGLLPYWLGLIMTALALLQVVFAAWRGFGNGEIRGQTPPADESHRDSAELPQRRGSDPIFPRPRIPQVILASASLIATVAAMEVLGFILTFGLLSFFLVYVVERRSLPGAIVVAVAMVLSFLLVFRVFLPVQLPLSSWGF